MGQLKLDKRGFKMGLTKQQIPSDMKSKQWHYENCTIEYETEYGYYIKYAWCEEHKVDVTSCLPQYEG